MIDWNFFKSSCKKTFSIDHLLHMALSFMLVILLAELLPLWISTIIVVALGLGKEFIWDKKLGKGCFDEGDLMFDGIGIILAIGALIV